MPLNPLRNSRTVRFHFCLIPRIRGIGLRLLRLRRYHNILSFFLPFRLLGGYGDYISLGITCFPAERGGCIPFDD